MSDLGGVIQSETSNFFPETEAAKRSDARSDLIMVEGIRIPKSNSFVSLKREISLRNDAATGHVVGKSVCINRTEESERNHFVPTSDSLFV